MWQLRVGGSGYWGGFHEIIVVLEFCHYCDDAQSVVKMIIVAAWWGFSRSKLIRSHALFAEFYSWSCKGFWKRTWKFFSREKRTEWWRWWCWSQSSLWSLLLPAELLDSLEIFLDSRPSPSLMELLEMDRDRSQGLAVGSFSRISLAEDIRSRSLRSSSRLVSATETSLR